MKKRIVSVIVICIAMISVFSVSSLAANVDLYPDQTEAVSGTTTGYSAFFYGKNKETSKHMVYFEAQYSRDGVQWFKDKTIYVKVGEECPYTSTSRWSNACNWRLRLNPTGLYKNCAAYGYIFRDV